MLMSLLYYDITEVADPSQGLTLGPITITIQQISIGVITNLICSPPSILLVKLFTKTSRRVTRSTKLRIAIKKIKRNHFKHNKKSEDRKIRRKLKKERKMNADLRKPKISKVKQLKAKKMLPWWFKIIAYLLSYTISGLCIFFIIVKGINFGNDKCTAWVQSTFVSLFSSALVTEPIQV